MHKQDLVTSAVQVERQLHPLAWVGWLVAALVLLSMTRNPLHLFLILLCLMLVNASLRSVAGGAFQLVSPLRFALFVIPLSALFNAATVHFGDTVLLRLPSGLPVLGGPVTLEALAYGAINGLVLTGILTAFMTFNQALPIRALIRLIPRAFYPLAVIISIAITFVPITMRQFRQIREAQMVRGHRVRGLRDWLPLLMPLLISGLERALQLAEAITARGFASSGAVTPTRRDVAARLAVILGLVALLGGWLLRLVWGHEGVGLGLMSAGGGLIVGVLWVLGRRFPRTTYRPEPWTVRDWAAVLVAAAVLAVFMLRRVSLLYYPYPTLSLPAFDPLVGLATLGLLGPVWLWSRAGDAESLI